MYRSPSTRYSDFVTRLTCALLACVVLLQIPLPVVHRHHFDSSLDHASHLVEFHGSQVNGDFHWHFMLPSDFGRPADEDDPNESRRLTSTLDEIPVFEECESRFVGLYLDMPLAFGGDALFSAPSRLASPTSKMLETTGALSCADLGVFLC